jgi:hypothetical protein
MSYSETPHMTLHDRIEYILLTTHPGNLDYELDQNSNYLSKKYKVLIKTAGPENLFGKSGLHKSKACLL